MLTHVTLCVWKGLHVVYDTGEAVVKNSLNCFKTKVNWHQVIIVGVKPEEEQHNIN